MNITSRTLVAYVMADAQSFPGSYPCAFPSLLFDFRCRHFADVREVHLNVCFEGKAEMIVQHRDFR